MIASFVLDSSATMSWCFRDEYSAYADSVLTALRTSAATVPVLWRLEIRNVIVLGERRAHLKEADGKRFLAMLSALRIRTDMAAVTAAYGRATELARAHGLTVYDGTTSNWPSVSRCRSPRSMRGCGRLHAPQTWA